MTGILYQNYIVFHIPALDIRTKSVMYGKIKLQLFERKLLEACE